MSGGGRQDRPASARPGPRRPLWREAFGFAAAGAAAYAADLGLFVWLRGPGGLGPLTAKSLSFLAGCTVAYLGNALGTYRGRAPAAGRARQYGVFFAVNIAGALVQLICLGVSHYVLGFTAPRDDVVSGAGVGMAARHRAAVLGYPHAGLPPGPGIGRPGDGKRAPAGGG